MLGETLFCPLRKVTVAALPEEKVRQSLVHHMIHTFGYPPSAITLEISLKQLPHLVDQLNLPKRRADVLVLAKGIHPAHPLYPLLLIECKAVPITQQVIRQVVGYNYYLKAPFIAVVNHTQSLFGFYSTEQKDYVFQECFLDYQSLLNTSFVKLS